VSVVAVRVRVAAERYALAAAHVPEVATMGEITRVPGAPPRILGVRNLRGEVLPVVDLATALGLTGAGLPTRIVVAEHGEVRAGLAVEAVEDVGELPEVRERSDEDLLTGAAVIDGALVGVLDVPALLDRCKVAGA
jgi:purine-binding chemotaxis protein CheW